MPAMFGVSGKHAKMNVLFENNTEVIFRGNFRLQASRILKATDTENPANFRYLIEVRFLAFQTEVFTFLMELNSWRATPFDWLLF